MKRISYLIMTFSLLFIYDTIGQINDFKKYQSDINKAEINIVRNKKPLALNNYYKVLLHSDGNFSKDIYNALILSKELNKVDTFFIFLDLLKYKNYSNDYLDSLTEFKQFHKHPKWKKFIKTNNQKIYIDTALKAQINSLHSLDQFFRVKEGSYELYSDTINKIDSLNIITLLNVINKQGLPGEMEIGARDLRGDQGYDVVLHHYTQTKSIKKHLINLTPTLILQTQAGRIEPNKCAHYLEMQNGEFKAGVFDIFSIKFETKQSKYIIPKYSENQKIEIDYYRKLLFLESLEDYYEKVKFVIKNPDHKYIFDVRLNIIEVINEEMYDGMLRRGIELE